MSYLTFVVERVKNNWDVILWLLGWPISCWVTIAKFGWIGVAVGVLYPMVTYFFVDEHDKYMDWKNQRLATKEDDIQ